MKRQEQELAEALHAADNALEHLYTVREQLRSAGNWGLFDIVAGGFLASAVKRSKMNNAQRELDAARDALAVFVRELHDVEGAEGVHIETDGFVSAIDLFLDNPFVDVYVQSQIDSARERVAAAIEQVEEIRDQLSRRRASS